MKKVSKASKLFLFASLFSVLFLALTVSVSARTVDNYRSHWWTTKDLGEIHITGVENEATSVISNVSHYKITRGTAQFSNQVITRPSQYVATLTYSAGYNGYIYVTGQTVSI